MESFKQFYKSKGAFKQFPKEQQPERIPLSIYDTLADVVKSRMGQVADVFIPSSQKSIGKSDTGDLDIILNPHNRATWREDIKSIFKDHIIASKSNGPQLMTVMKGLIDDKQYMIDFIIAKEGSFEYRSQYAKFGTIIPAVVGSFARSLRYKFDQQQLYGRFLSAKGNYHNIPLTNDFEKAMNILMLDLEPVRKNELYTAEQVANWVISSPRFDSGIWRQPPSPDGQTINVRNKKAHRASKLKPEVQECYKLIDTVQKKATWDNTDYKIERMILGSDFIDNILQQVQEVEKKQENIVTGHDVMRILGIKGGPEIGIYLKNIKDAGYSQEEAIRYLERIKNER
jgi:hypothetical protein